MPIAYRFDVLQALKDKGYSSYRIRQEKIFGQRVLQQFRNGVPVSWDTIARLRRLLGCQPGDILAYAEDDSAAPVATCRPTEKGGSDDKQN